LVVRRVRGELYEFALFSVDRHDVLSGTVGPLAIFFFDVVSLTGPRELKREVHHMLMLQARAGDPSYRQRYPEEYTLSVDPVEPLTGRSAVAISEAIARAVFASVEGMPLEMETIDPFVNLLDASVRLGREQRHGGSWVC
jgi:hypothetical protein